jgi:hypothetical protein
MGKKTSLAFFCIAVLAALAIGTQSADAFQTYSQDRDATNCRLCHGNFRADNYLSNSDREDWGNLHDLHRRVMFEEDTPVSKCDTCHMGGGDLRFPVFLNESSSDYLDPIACLGCHGRYEDDNLDNPDFTAGRGAGLRQHHTNAGINACMVCHEDADPANYTPVGENVQPPYRPTISRRMMSSRTSRPTPAVHSGKRTTRVSGKVSITTVTASTTFSILTAHHRSLR